MTVRQDLQIRDSLASGTSVGTARTSARGTSGQTAIGIGTGIVVSSALRISRQRRRRASFFFRNLP